MRHRENEPKIRKGKTMAYSMGFGDVAKNQFDETPLRLDNVFIQDKTGKHARSPDDGSSYFILVGTDPQNNGKMIRYESPVTSLVYDADKKSGVATLASGEEVFLGKMDSGFEKEHEHGRYALHNYGAILEQERRARASTLQTAQSGSESSLEGDRPALAPVQS